MDQSTIRILVMSTDGTAVWLISQTLADEGFVVDTTSTEDEAVVLLRENTYELVVIEPDKVLTDRIRVLDSISPGRPIPPVIILTGHDRIRSVVELLRKYPGDYITKDFDGKYVELMPYVVDKTLERHYLLVEKNETENELKRIADEKLAILNSMSEMVLYLDEDKNVLWTNNSITESIGISQKELSGRRCFEILMKRPQPCDGCPLAAVIQSRLPQMAEITTEDGKIWSIALYPEMDDNGDIKGIVEVKQDVTERRTWEQKLRQASDEWRTTFDSIIDIIAINDSHFKFIKVNKAFADLFGLEPKDIIGKTCHELLYGYTDPCADCPQTKAYGSDASLRLEYFEPRFGEHIEITASPILSDDDQVIGLVTIGKDIAQQAQLSERLRRASSEWRTTFDSIVDPISIVDKDLKIIKSNRSFADSMDKEPRQLVGLTCYEALHSRSEPCSHCPQPIALETKTTAITDYYDERWKKFIQVSSSPVFDEDGDIVGFVNVKNDITGQKKERDDLKKYSGHLKKMVGQLSEELKDAQVRIIEKSQEKAQRQIAGKLGLELKRSLGTIAQALSQMKGSHQDPARVKAADEQIRRLDAILANLLFYSRERAPKREEIVVSELITRVLEKNLPPDSINLTLNIPFDVPYVFVDPNQIEHAIGNLISNAVESMPNGGDLTIKAEKKGTGVSVSITDSGPGIPAKTMKKVFEPLYTTKPGSIGIGLAVAKHLLEVNAGTILLENNDSAGVAVSAYLPTADGAPAADSVESLFKEKGPASH